MNIESSNIKKRRRPKESCVNTVGKILRDRGSSWKEARERAKNIKDGKVLRLSNTLISKKGFCLTWKLTSTTTCCYDVRYKSFFFLPCHYFYSKIASVHDSMALMFLVNGIETWLCIRHSLLSCQLSFVTAKFRVTTYARLVGIT